MLLRAMIWGLMLSTSLFLKAESTGHEGLLATFKSGGKSDTATLPNLWLHVPANQSPTPFLSAGPFTATFEGMITVDLRAEYSFEAEVQGSVKLTVNGTLILEAADSPAKPVVSKAIRLNKGTNSILAEYQAPSSGDAFLRMEWMPKGGQDNPIPASALSHADSDELTKSSAALRGRTLVVEHRCLKCHSGPASSAGGMPELAYDAPTFEAIGSRRGFSWMRDWISDPKKMRPSARMPQVFHGAEAPEQARAVAAFLTSLKAETSTPAPLPTSEDDVKAGQKLFTSLNCEACHISPDKDETDPLRNPLKHVAAKFNGAPLTAFLLAPAAHYEWSRMPKFKLKPEEAGQIAAYLLARANKASDETAPSDADLVTKGKTLVQTSGCLNCHSLKLDNQFSTKSLSALAAADWKKGCVGAEASAKSVSYQFKAADQAALQAFAETDRSSLERHVSWEFAMRQSGNLKCIQCHGKFEGFPVYEILGGKIKPEWGAKFIAGEVAYKPRPWIESQMPAFVKFAQPMAQGMAAVHGLPPATPEEPPIDAAQVAIGQKLVSPVGGFSCVLCHGAGELAATQVFESAGINFGYTAERIQRTYYNHWLRNPQSVDPATKMPVYFTEEDGSPLSDVLDGSSTKQREAIWQYFRMGWKMPTPPLQ